MAESDGSRSYRAVVQTPHDHAFHPDKKILTWHRLESLRLQKLGLGNRYSRHFNVLRQSHQREQTEIPFELTCVVRAGETRTKKKDSDLHKNNSLAPFATVGKATCGFFFNDKTNNKKINFGIPPSDLVKWRNFPAQGS